MGRYEVVGRQVERSLVGRPRQVANALDTLTARGDLVDRGPVRRIGTRRVEVDVRYIDRTPPVRKRDRTLRRVVVVFASGFGAAGLTGLVVELLTGDLLLVAGLAFAALFLAAGAALRLLGGDDVGISLPNFGTCAGAHCSGCSRH